MKQKYKRVLALFLALCVIIVQTPLDALAVEGVSYVSRSWDEATKQVTESTGTCSTYTPVTASLTAWGGRTPQPRRGMWRTLT